MKRERSDQHGIVADFLAGHEEVTASVRGWIRSVVRFQRWRFADPEGLEQDILLKLIAVVQSDRYRMSASFKTFVYSVSENTCIDVYRSERLRTRVEGREAPEREIAGKEIDPEEAQIRRERLEQIRYIFQRLSERCRRLWIWVYRDGLPAGEVARRLGISPGNARVRVHRCLQEARAIAEDYLPGSASQ